MHMDPQQRILLQHAWEALAGLPGMEGSLTSVAIGIGTVEYTSLASRLGTGIFTATGASLLMRPESGAPSAQWSG